MTPAPTILGSGPDETVLSLSEDAWNGDAQFTVSVDGQQIGGVQTVSASHALGQSQEFDLRGTFGGGQRTVTVTFLNDAWGGTAASDRNLYVTGASCDGVAAGGSLAFLTNGAQSLVVGTAPAPVTVGSGPDTLDLKVNEDAWNGDAQFTVSVDGRQIGGTLTAQAYRCMGGVQDILVLGSFGAGPHTAAVSFINDAWGGTAAADRNLYVTAATMDGAAIGGSALTLIANGAGSFAFQGVAPVSGNTLPAPTLALAAASDSGVAGDNVTRTAKPTFAGVAQAGATVGVQIDGSFVGTGQADAAGSWSYTVAAALADGTHTVTATAVDAGNASAATKLALTIDTSTMAPTVALAPASDSGVVGDGITSVAQPTFTGAAEPGATVSLRVDGALVGSIQADAAGTWNCTPAAPLAIGKHSITATAADAAGNTSDTTSLTVSSTLPAPTLGLTPATDSGVPGDGITNADRPVFTGVAKPGSKVTLLIDGKSLGSTTANATGLWSYAPAGTLGPRTYTVTATASDVAGNTSAAATLPLTVDFECYYLTITLAPATDDGIAGDLHTTVTRPIFTGVADAGATVSLMVDGTLAGTARADASGTWNCVPAAAMAVGNHTITATATDLAGNHSGIAIQWVTIDAGAPAIPQPTVAGDTVGLVLQNNQPAVLAAREITFGQAFAAGQVRPGDGLAARIDGVLYPVQMDVKTTNADGSVATAVLTMQQPALAAGTSTGVMLTRVAATAAPSIDLSTLTPAAYRCTVDLSLHNTDGTTTPVHIDAAAALASAVTSGAVSYWLAGPQATQARVDVPVSGSLHVTLDITAYADGTTSTDVQFNNDLAMTPRGGTVVYDATITQNNAVAFSQSNITQYQYQTWHRQVWSNGTPQLNVQHDVPALERTGLIQAYDQTTGIAASLINYETTGMAGAGFGILGNAQITQYMPMTGGRGDIGPTTLGNATWLITQNQTAAQYALAQADAAGSIPWHLFDPKNGVYVRVTDYPLLWPDGRAVSNGEIDLTQSLPSPDQTGWTPDPAHAPDLDYIPYLMTGSRYYLDQLNAEADYDEVSTWPAIRQGAQGLLAFTSIQVRAQAWSLRQIAEAAAANPDGSAEKAYFNTLLQNNISFVLSEAAAAHQGESTGWIDTGGSQMAPWQQDFFATTIALAAEQGVAGAKQVLLWETNYLAGRFLAAAQGFDPDYGIAYWLEMFDPSVGHTSPYQTWAQIAQHAAVTAAPPSPPGQWDSAYSAGARAALAGDITVTASPDAIHAYGIVVANSPGAGISYQQQFPGFDIVPRLPDGQLLTSDHVIVSADTIAREIHGSDADQLIYETGSGNVTIVGGAGINLLYAGSGNDTLIGGPNRDYLFGGSGSDSFSAGAGSNYMEAGSGAAVFALAASDAAQDLIADFKSGIDRMVVTDPAGVHASAIEISSYIAGATADSSGAAVLHLSANHDVTLQGIAVGQLSASLFG